MALQHLGHDELLELVVELWRGASPSPTRLLEHLSTGNMSQPVLNILKIAQARVGAFVPGQAPALGIVTLYARHASDLADGLITRLPKELLSRAWRGSCLEIDLGI
jgi:hypothetical protein